MTVDAENREEAVSKFKTMMNQEAITAHMNKRHSGQPIMSVEECHAMIEKDVVAV